jgi:hypothetical protein
MYNPLLAAAAVAALIAFAPLSTPRLLTALDAGDLFAPLTCAMAQSGPCFLTHEYADPAQDRLHPKRLQPMLAAMQ